MKTVTKEYKVYMFDELSEDAKENALEKFREINVDYDGWDDFILEEWQDKLTDKGFTNPEINYSGFWNQGDGASFTCKRIDVSRILKSEKLITRFQKIYNWIKNDKLIIWGEVKRIDYHYCHYNTIAVYLEHENLMETDAAYNKMEDYLYDNLSELEGCILEIARDYSKEIYEEIRKEFIYATEDQQVIDTILINEYEFTVDGNLF